MHFYLATDHAGFEVKPLIKGFLEAKGHTVTDLGPDSADRVDYPDFAKKLCEKLLDESGSMGVLVCGTGIGMSVSANRFPNIRAALCHDAYTASMARAHNDANVLCMGQRVVGPGTMESILQAWLEGAFEGGRHGCRVQKIER